MNKEKLLKLYEQMLVLRHFDEMCYELKMKDLIMDGYHPYVGQEACAVGASSGLNADDVVISNHRPQGHSIAKGSTPKSIFAEMLGRRGGVSEGIGGPMQWIDSENQFFCGSIVGSGMTIACGVALAMKKAGKNQVCLCYFGDGSTNTGSFHEAMNMAAVWNLPVVFLLENNQYGEAMPVKEHCSCVPIAGRCAAYGYEGVTVDGMDVNAVTDAVEKAIADVRAGNGPAFVECDTYRFRGHYGGDPEHLYRTKEEVDEWRKKDPVVKTKNDLVEMGVKAAELDDLEAKVVKGLEADRDWAVEQPFPTLEQATDHVWIPLS